MRLYRNPPGRLRRTALQIVLIASALVVLADRGPYRQLTRHPSGQALLALTEILADRYLGQVDFEKGFEAASRALIESLDDRFTAYRSAALTRQERETLSGEYSGVGILIEGAGPGGTQITVVSTYPNGPAREAGIWPGDVIVAVDNQSVVEWTTAEAVGLIRGPEGTRVTLTVQRPGVPDTLSFTITRRRLQVVDVHSTMVGDIGYVAISTFSNSRVAQQLSEALGRLQAQGARGLILDLRDNSGGLLAEGVAVADAFLEEGPIVFMRDGSGRITRSYAAGPGAYSGPLAVLVNRFSASASEIVAGALQEQGRAAIVGETTFGKGVAQEIIPLPNGASVVLVVQEWLTPEQHSINRQGITPDLAVAQERALPLALRGENAAPGEVITLLRNGQPLGEVVAGSDGTFTFLDRRLISPEEGEARLSGEALVDPENDAQLRAALAYLRREE